MRKAFKALQVSFMVLFVSAVAYGSDYTGVLNEAPYKIRVPENWNGELLMYAHGYGYLERWDPAVQFDYSYADAAPAGSLMENFLLSQGYALAGTTFSGTGWQVKEGIPELVSLSRLFKRLVGRPKRTILIGYSLGSLLALKGAEEVPVYDGVIAGCTAGAGTTKAMDLVGAFALAYDTLFGWPEAWGTWHNVKNEILFNRDVLPVLYAQAADPANAPKFEFMRLLTAEPLEGFYNEPRWLFLGMFMATEVRADLQRRAKGPVTQNSSDRYVLSDADKAYLAAIGFTGAQVEHVLAAMNAQTTITIADDQKLYMEKFFDPSGDLQIPVISLHETGDGLAPAYLESVLRTTVQTKGKEELFVQVFTDSAWHCGFTGPQLFAAIKAMDAWLDTGMKPGAEAFPAEYGFVPGYMPPPWPIGTK